MVGLSRRWTGGPVDRWTGLTASTLPLWSSRGGGGGEKTPAAGNSAAAGIAPQQ